MSLHNALLLQPPKALNAQQLAEREEEQRKAISKLPRPTMASRTETNITLSLARSHKEDSVSDKTQFSCSDCNACLPVCQQIASGASLLFDAYQSDVLRSNSTDSSTVQVLASDVSHTTALTSSCVFPILSPTFH